MLPTLLNQALLGAVAWQCAEGAAAQVGGRAGWGGGLVPRLGGDIMGSRGRFPDTGERWIVSSVGTEVP
jgi:hypothetical protein